MTDEVERKFKPAITKYALEVLERYLKDELDIYVAADLLAPKNDPDGWKRIQIMAELRKLKSSGV